MGKSERRKGQRLEREVAKLLECVIPGLERQLQSRRGPKRPDLETAEGLPDAPFRIEVSGGQRPSPHKKAIQAQRDADQADDHRPILVLTKRDGGIWLVSLWIGDFINIFAQEIKAMELRKEDE